MKDVIKEYTQALEENIAASKLENEAKDRKRKAYYRLVRARESLRALELQTLEETCILN
jgi:hypothetical protein